MRWIESTLIFSFFIISCDQGEVPIKSLDNPLDIDAASEKGVNTPALDQQLVWKFTQWELKNWEWLI